MSDYKTPDVYVEEISTLPPSVAEVSTAIPAFIGYTGNETYNGKPLTNVPTRITSFLEFKTIFGDPLASRFTATVSGNGGIVVTRQKSDLGEHTLYYALDHYFKNGGGDCYVVSLGAYATKDKAAFAAGIDALLTEDEPTLIILSEAVTLAATSYDDYITLCQQALDQCGGLKDRFCIIDVPYDASKNVPGDAAAFRNKLSSESLKYGAAYYPYLETTLNYQYKEGDVSVGFNTYTWGQLTIFSDVLGTVYKQLVTTKGTDDTKIKISAKDGVLTIDYPPAATYKGILDAWNSAPIDNMTLSLNGDGSDTAAANPNPVNLEYVHLSDISKTQTAVYNAIKQEISKQRVTLPPSPAMAGVYAAVDRDRGVWKAPANVALNAVITPTAKISSNDQMNLNIDVTGGKSINAIRGFLGKGTLVWGARTLTGNDNEWRYVNVRRLFNMIEESTKKASYFAVFESNTATTWLKVKGMIESFLYRLWQQGALAGSTPKAAYFVHVGLGATMTQQDVLEGRMIVEIGIAAVRPAEFIVLRFSHKLQEL